MKIKPLLIIFSLYIAAVVLFYGQAGMLDPIKKARLFKALGYFPTEKQAACHYANKNIFLIGGNRSGKSMFGGMEGIAQAVVPESHIWTVAPSYELADKVFRLVYNNAFKLNMPLTYDQSSPPYFATNLGVEVWAKSTEKLTSLEGESVDLGILDEIGFYNKLVWNRLIVRFDKKTSRIIIIGTPKGKNTWMRQLFNEKSMDKDHWLCLNMPTDEQPFISREFIEMAERELGGKDAPAYREQIRGEFVPYGLLIYPMFKQDNIGAMEINKKWKFIVGTDAGYVHPCAAAFWVISPSEVCYKFAEYDKQYLRRQTNAENIIDLTVKFQKQFNIKCDCVYYPPEDPSFGEDLATEARKYSIPTAPADNAVEDGLELIRRLMENNLKIHPSCGKTIFNYQNYCNKEDSEVIMKINDDHCDADRYALLSHFRSAGKSLYRIF